MLAMVSITYNAAGAQTAQQPRNRKRQAAMHSAAMAKREGDMSISRRDTIKLCAAAAASVAMPHYARAQGTGWSKLRGQTIVVNWPAHPHYAVAKTLLPAFTAETGIKVELDEMQYLRLKDAQVLQMSKPKGDYDVEDRICAAQVSDRAGADVPERGTCDAWL